MKPDNDICKCECGFTWKRGFSGHHYCEPQYQATIASLEVERDAALNSCTLIAEALGITGAVAGDTITRVQQLVGENAALKNAVIWNDSKLVQEPQISVGTNQTCWIAAEYQGAVEVVFAHYINRPCDNDEQEDLPDWTYYTEDGDVLNAVGWYLQRGFDEYYEPLPSYITVIAWSAIERPIFATSLSGEQNAN
ncbi:hypothetical protein [Yersinia enterocolitica]|uniref:hypothetical protein n=1 Tax=Yersinia enterocolitica TaxID=630 RepID=UPI00313BAA1A|nr:hypothetical protein [Yersinia enterocolitica]